MEQIVNIKESMFNDHIELNSKETNKKCFNKKTISNKPEDRIDQLTTMEKLALNRGV